MRGLQLDYVAESLLTAMDGSPMGIGGDIGGSIRVPAALCGLYGLLPSPGRISTDGVVIPTPGCDAIVGALGPFARSLRDLELFCRAYSSTLPWIEDRGMVPAELLSPAIGQQFDPSRRVRVGVMVDDNVISPLPAVRRVLDKVIQRLGASSAIEVKPFTPWDHATGWKIIAANYFEGTGEDIRKKCILGGEPLEPLTEWILKQCEDNTPAVGRTLQERKAARDDYRVAYAKHWNEAGIDVLVSPITPSIALPLGTSKYWAYSAVWNLLAYPAIALPASKLVGEKNPAHVLDKEGYIPKNEIESNLHKLCPSVTAEGMPVGIQVIAPRLHETYLMDAARIIEEALVSRSLSRL